ncbi:trimeric intracellular cation channel family protein [Pseudomonas otitidis]|uniref:trimeric intracellular cation channel family protein n=1 Tax=Metapseudomonas otitidis TaxID=319939 RepID=UPI000D1B962F|nr:trimeric intracellular cation channel family protein [Pseudomonas otitidis]MDH1106950.1 trimeric intracellular cation channel family protein [Pseudomonas otitidis]MDH1160793.1 trimeric intracellular cation channel family protein [Pseudomonas otitidis]MDH1165918.1 trimeric intracellular cation channel family protein [Pseudomonas otitidis]
MLTSVYLIAICAEAMSGALAAGRRNMDLFGVSLIAFLTALGGGTVRDILLGHYPVSWTQHPEYIFLTIGAGLTAMLLSRFMHHLRQLFLVLDAMGLIAFTVIGCNVALGLNYALPVVVMAGIITGIFGGILRDILCNRTPQVLRQELYASVSLLVALLYLGLRQQGVNEDINLLASFSVGLLLRLSAIRFGWSLPMFSYAPGRWEH